MKNKAQEWVLFPWFKEHGENHVHTSDINKLSALIPYGRAFQKLNIDGDYVVLKYGDESYRVKPDLLIPIPSPEFEFGETVKASDKIGSVVEIGWHFNERKPFYIVKFNSKRSSRRFFQDELASVD